METQTNLKQIEKQDSVCSFTVKFLDTSKLSRGVSADDEVTGIL